MAEHEGKVSMALRWATKVDGAVQVKDRVTPGGAKAGGTAPTARVDVPAGGARAGGYAPAPSIHVSPIPDLKDALWLVAGGYEPDGGVWACLRDPRTGETLKMVSEVDFEDAWLALGIDTYLASAEGWHGPAADGSDPRDGEEEGDAERT